MTLRKRGYLEEQNSGLRWKKVQRGGVLRAKGSAAQKMWDWVTQSKNHKWMLRQTGRHPDKEFEHGYKRTFWQIYRDGKPFGKSVKNLVTAQANVESWVEQYDI